MTILNPTLNIQLAKPLMHQTPTLPFLSLLVSASSKRQINKYKVNQIRYL